MHLPRMLLLCALSWPVIGFAETLSLPPGAFELPDGLQTLDRSETPDESTGKPSGIAVFTREGDLPRAVFIVTYVPAASDEAPFDARDAAVKIGNPFDPSLGPDAAKFIVIDGAPAAAYAGTLPNGLEVKSYAVEHNGYRIVVLLKGPAQKPYRSLMSRFAQAFEGLRWSTPSPTPVAMPETAAPSE
ncbi:MAG: hypothetical protein ACOY82_05780 [Pseudomonadota bacterium]